VGWKEIGVVVVVVAAAAAAAIGCRS